jgi:hypothetical protein
MAAKQPTSNPAVFSRFGVQRRRILGHRPVIPLFLPPKMRLFEPYSGSLETSSGPFGLFLEISFDTSPEPYRMNDGSNPPSAVNEFAGNSAL